MNHKELYDKIPSFECKPGCTDCCQPTQFFDEYELKQIKPKLPSGFDCAYRSQAGCDIYENRPLICRMFGAVDGLNCSHGYQPDVKLTKQEGLEIMKIYNKGLSK